MSERFKITEKTKLKRLPKRGNFDRETVYQILDEAFVCHVGFTVENQPFVIPTAYGRKDDVLYIHGSAASRMMKNLAMEIDICVTVTILDGLVLARSAFHHSVNYRSVVIFGKAELVTENSEKFEALRIFTEHIIPNRWNEIREPNAKELKATTVLRLPITEASAKMRFGNPIDDDEDMSLNIWAGVIPIELTAQSPISDDLLAKNIEMPDHVKNYRRK